MTMKANLVDHLEVMRHEICGLDFTLEHQGYRVDGDQGIKKVVGLNNGKSVDYFHIQNRRCRFIEFSDLARGQEDLLGWQESLDQITNNLHRNKFKKLLKPGLRDDTLNEMVAKFKDSRDIFNKIPDFYEQPPAAFLDDDAKTFYIVHVPINDELPDADKAEIARFLTTLQAQISGSLEDEICDRVKLVLLAPFVDTLVKTLP
jgi:hypothetical protein